MINNQQQSANRSMAALSYITRLSEQLMPKQEIPQESEELVEEPLELEEGPVEEMTEEPQEESKEENLSKEFEEFKGEVKGINETKFDELLKALKKDE